MSPDLARPGFRVRPHRSWIATAMALILALGACSAAPAATFSPLGPCLADGRAAGAYPEMEARIPATFDGRAPDQLDSGRTCTTVGLGMLAQHDITETRFAGGLWQLGRSSGVTLAAFEGAGLDATWLAEFYEAGARSARNTFELSSTRPTIAGRPGFRIDTQNGNSRQSVLVWPSADGSFVRVVLAADVAEETIDAAVRASESGPQRR